MSSTGMTKKGTSLTIVIPLFVSGIYALRYRSGMTVRGGISSSRCLLAGSMP
ncbi:MAG: hypothetical protein ACEY3L_03620 [Wolbachia sp.]